MGRDTLSECGCGWCKRWRERQWAVSVGTGERCGRYKQIDRCEWKMELSAGVKADNSILQVWESG